MLKCDVENYQVRNKCAQFSAVGHHVVSASEWLQGTAYQHISYLESHERKFCRLHQYVHWKADMSNFSMEELTVFNIKPYSQTRVKCDIIFHFILTSNTGTTSICEFRSIEGSFGFLPSHVRITIGLWGTTS